MKEIYASTQHPGLSGLKGGVKSIRLVLGNHWIRAKQITPINNTLPTHNSPGIAALPTAGPPAGLQVLQLLLIMLSNS